MHVHCRTCGSMEIPKLLPLGSVSVSLAAQTAFFLLHGGGKKGSGTLTKDFLSQHSPGLGWILITSMRRD